MSNPPVEPVLPDAIFPLLVVATERLLTHSAPDGRLTTRPGQFEYQDWFDFHVLAVTYTRNVPGNRFYQDGRVADLIRRAGQALIARFNDPQQIDLDGQWYDNRPDEWVIESWLLAYDLLRQAGAADLTAGWADMLRRCARTYLNWCRQADHLKRMTSPNLKISTNHFAYFAADMIRLGQVFENDEHVQAGLKVIRKIEACQHPDGYWPETQGPTTSYNLITATAMALCYQYTRLPEFLDGLRKALDFHQRFIYPDAICVETIDQRVRYPSASTFSLHAFSHWPDGRAWAENRFRRALPSLQSPLAFAVFGRLATSWLYYERGPVEPAAATRGDYVARLSDLPGGVARREPWMVGLCGIPSRPRNHNFTLDRQNLLSVWHRDCGLILGGGNNRDNPRSATFYARLMNDPTAVVHDITHEHVHVPVDATLDLGPDGGSLDLEYWGFDARLDVRIDGNACRIGAFAGTLPVNDPVLFSLNVMLDARQPLQTGAGQDIVLGDQPIALDARQAGGWIGQGRWRLSLPDGATVSYPLVPYRVNVKTQSLQRLALVSAPVTNRAAEFVLTVSNG